MALTAYLAHRGFEDKLIAELGSIDKQFDRLILTNEPAKDVFWADNIWFNPKIIGINSIGDAAKHLKSIQRNWVNYRYDFYGRSKLIIDKLPHISFKPIEYPNIPPKSPLGSWSLMDNHTMLYSAECSSTFPNGEIVFNEDKEIPPNRAYLKLWELFTREEHIPRKGQRCIDLGACPGGWTWVLQKLGAEVVSVDKAPLEKHIAGLDNVYYLKDSAFALDPYEIGHVDWLFSDIICYPERLLTLIKKWMDSGMADNMVCTIKLQGDPDLNMISEFAKIPNSRIMHLYNNKNELTWIWRK